MSTIFIRMCPLRRTAAAALVVAALACGDGSDPGQPGPTPVIAIAKATASGDAQTGAAGLALADPIRVRVTSDGAPKAGVTITWATTGTGAAVTPVTSQTDAQGIASTSWTLARTTGSKSATATLSGASGSPVSFTATAVAGAPTTLVSTAGNNQSGRTDQLLGDQLRVNVQDQFGNPVAGVAVNWEVTSGGGSIAPTAPTTSATGESAARWTLGAVEGAQTATASATGLNGSPVTFTATATGIPGGIVTVTVNNDFFNPTSQDVLAGAEVRWVWTNTGAVPHSVRSQGSPSFPSSTIMSGDNTVYSHTFTTPGTYTYDCEVHGSAMSGTIIVH